MKNRLVIIPGWREKVESFDVIGNILKDDIEIKVIPLPGFQIKIDRPYNFDDYLKYLEKELADFKSFNLMGHSFGGALAMLYSLRFPNKIQKLILYNSAIIRKKGIKQKIVSVGVRIFKPIEKKISSRLTYLIKKFFYRFIVGSYDYFLVDENLKKTFANINQDLSNLAEKIQVPTIILWGKYDKATPLKNAYLLKKKIKNAEMFILSGGHNLHKEIPTQFAEVLRNILTK